LTTTSTARRIRRRASEALAFVAAICLAAVCALPAYAGTRDDPGGTAATAAPARGNGLDIAEGDAPSVDLHASYAALSAVPTSEQLAAAYRLADGTIAWPAADDYPLKDDANMGGMSDRGYGIRTCTDFVAWRLNRDAGSYTAPWLLTWSYLTPTGGDGVQWKYAWDAHGWPESTIPVPGAVAWFGDGMNHVGYVNSVYDDGTVLLEDYNTNPYAYDQRVVPASSIPLYLYPPPLPQ